MTLDLSANFINFYNFLKMKTLFVKWFLCVDEKYDRIIAVIFKDNLYNHCNIK